MQKLAVSMGVVLIAAGFSAACHKKVAATVPPAPSGGRQYTAVGPAPGPEQHAVQTTRAVPTPQRPRMPDAKTRARIDELLARIQDAYFDYDRHNIRPDAEKTLRSDAATLGSILKDYPDFKLAVQGNCDERGSDEYNLGLGEARAEKAKEYLAALGIPAAQMTTISYGKEKPVCTEHNEACWQKNRRAHIAAADTVSGG